MKKLVVIVIVLLTIGIALVVGGTIRNCIEGKYGHLDRVSIQ